MAINIANVLDAELVARFLFDGDFRRASKLPKPNSLMPMTFKGQLETSVYRIRGLSELEIWSDGRAHVETQRSDGKKIAGRIDVLVSLIRSFGLEVRSDPPPDRHAIVQGWPVDKEKQKTLCQEIVSGLEKHDSRVVEVELPSP